jgi:hypothetical protein
VTGVSTGVISAISCPDASDCTAAGHYDDSFSLNQAFTVDEQQGSWSSATLLAARHWLTPTLFRRSASRAPMAGTAAA